MDCPYYITRPIGTGKPKLDDVPLLPQREWAEENKKFLRHIVFEGYNLSGAKLSEADLHASHLKGINLKEADLRWADLTGADLREAHLEGAHLEGAHLEGVRWKGANITNTTGLTEEQHEQAIRKGAKDDNHRQKEQQELETKIQKTEHPSLFRGVRDFLHSLGRGY